MHPEHRIDEFTLDLSFTTTRLARREKAGLVSWISEELLPALDTLFSYYSPSNQVLRFETLEFDLGRLDARHYQQQIREQLLEQFTRLLKGQLLALDPRALSSPPLIPVLADAQAALQQLIAYLATGNITAHYAFNRLGRTGNAIAQAQSREKIHQQLFEQVVAQQDIADLLRQLPARELLVARLVKQFSAAQRLVLLRQLAPQQLPQVQMLLDLLAFIGQQHDFFPATRTHVDECLTTPSSAAVSPTAATVFAADRSALLEALWQELLLLALESPHATANVWLTQLLDKLATRLAMSKKQLSDIFLSIALPTSAAHPLNHLQMRIAELIQPVSSPTETQRQATSALTLATSAAELLTQDKTTTPLAVLQQKIAQALISGDVHLLHAIWPTLVAREPDLLLAALQHYLPQAEIRQQLMMHLPLSMQADVIGFLAADLKPLFVRLQQMAQPLLDALAAPVGGDNTVALLDGALTDDAHTRSNESAAHLPRHLWEIAVGLLLSPASAISSAAATADPADFFQRLIGAYAQLHSLNADELQQRWPQVIQAIAVEPSRVDSQTRAARAEYSRHQLPAAVFSATRVSSDSPASHVLPHGASSTQALDSVSDHQLFDLCLRLKSGAVSWSPLSADPALLQRMIDSYIRLGHNATAENCRDFIAAIDHQAAATHTPVAFYRAVLQALIADKWIDLEAISSAIAKSSTSSDAHSGSEINPVHTPTTNPTIAAPTQMTAINESLHTVTQPHQQPQQSQQSQQSPDADLFVNPEHSHAHQSALVLTASTNTSAATRDQPIRINPLATTTRVLNNQNQIDDGNKNLHNGQAEVTTDRTAPLSSREDALLNTQYTQPQPSTLHTHLQSLLAATQPFLHLQQLHLSNDQWQAMCSELIVHHAIMDAEAALDLLQSINTFSHQALNTAVYYRKVVYALMQQQSLDLELLASAENDHAPESSLVLTASTGLSQAITDAQLAAKPVTATAQGYTSQAAAIAGEKDFAATPSPIDTEKTPVLSSKADDAQLATRHAQTLPSRLHTYVQTLLAAAQPLDYLQQLHLDNNDWQDICHELILHQALIDKDSAADLLQSINTFAHQALDAAGFYRNVIHNLLQQQPIDLEWFAKIPADNSHTLVNTATSPFIRVADPHSRLGDTTDLPSDNSDMTTADVALHSPDYIQPPATRRPLDFSSATHAQIPQLTGSDDSLRKPVISLAHLLNEESTFTRDQLLVLQQHINFLLQHATADVISEWLALLGELKNHSPLIRAVPAHLLHQIVMRLQPSSYPPVDAVVKVVNESLALLAVDTSSLLLKQAKWEFIFHTLFVLRPSTVDKKELTDTLCRIFARAVGIDDVQRLLNLAERRAALLTPPARQQPAMRLHDLQSTQQATENSYSWEAGIPIYNAGQVLAAAFMPRLFAMLELTQEGKFVHPAAADRAAHLVQFMVSGETHTPEYELTLNKILCGISTSLPISEGIELSEHEQNTIEQMLTSMIQHWKVLGSTSIAGLRETFFQRQGWLVLEEDCWRLKVQERTFDMLLDRLPWSISLIKHSWMDKPLRVSWRDQS